MRYAIYEGNMERLRKKIVRIQNKCAKYGCEFRYEEVGEEFRDYMDENGNEFTLRFVLVEAEGRALVNGWRFVASIDATDKGNIINRACDIEVPERYYDCDIVCEHCGNKRVKYAFIVMNEETGEFKMVGRNCLKDFTFGMSAEGVAKLYDGVDELIKGEAVDGCGYHDRYINREEFMRYAAETIRHFGYAKNDPYSAIRSTASRTEAYYGVDHGWNFPGDLREEYKGEMLGCGFDADRPENAELVKKACEWVLGHEDNSNYMHNLKVACANDFISVSATGLLVSVFPTFDRELERQYRIRREAEAGKSSEWVGEVGKRVTVKFSATKLLTSWETMYGVTYVWKIVGDDGNIYTWKTGNSVPDAGTITGTVKEHKEFRGVKQTELTRCRVA